MALTPSGGLAMTTPATPSTPIDALPAGIAHGYIQNPPHAPGNLYVNVTGPAVTGFDGTTQIVYLGETFYLNSPSTLPVSVASLFPNHPFIAVQYN